MAYELVANRITHSFLSRRAAKMIELARTLLKSTISKGGFDALVLSKVTLTSVKKGHVVFEFKIGPEHLNRVMSTHGGVICTLVDISGSIAVASMTGGPDTGVSTDISVSFISGSKLNETLIVESFCHKAGRNLAYTTTSLRLKESGSIVATGSHTKYIGKPKSKL